jgi:hypothetical protein
MSPLAALLLCMALPQAASADTGSPFDKLKGAWHGSGQVRLQDGSSERLACNGYYNEKSGGSQLSLAIRCQSATKKIEMRGNLHYSGGRVQGHWEERTFHAEGDIGGSANANGLHLNITGPVNGSMSIAVTPSSHKVSISTPGAGFKGVSISFRRG